jgi:hypothetical protein
MINQQGKNYKMKSEKFKFRNDEVNINSSFDFVQADKMKSYCKAKGISMRQFIRDAVREKLINVIIK